jgi:hypothetical protein
MVRNKFLFLLIAVVVVGFQSSVSAQDMTVFGMKLADQFTLKECDRVAKEVSYSTSGGIIFGGVRTKRPWIYEYVNAAPVGNPCFRRYGLDNFSWKKKADMGQLPPPREFVTVVSPAGTSPTLAAKGLFDVWVMSDGRIDGVLISFEKENANDVFETLKGKYGDKVKVTPMQWKNSEGATYDYYKAEWDSPTLIIRFQSAGQLYTNDKSFSATLDSPFRSLYGQVSIGLKAPSGPPVKQVPL